jgi:hypothetical protein
MVQRAGGGEPYVIQLVRRDGRALPAVHATSRSLKTYFPPTSPCPGGSCPATATANYQLPETSVSATHVYFLDGEADLKSLAPGGAAALVRRLVVEPNSNVAFAVSPDDRRIAVAVITYGTSSATPFTLRLYAEDLGGGNRTDVFSSTSVAEWPVGWRAGSIVLAIGQPGVFTGFNPYAAVQYHLVEPGTWARRALLTCNFGPLVAAGSACWKPVTPTLGVQDWNGNTRTYQLDPGGPISRLQTPYLALSPAGTRIAGALKADPAGGYDTELFEDGSGSLLVPGAAPFGWLDEGHLLVIAPAGPALAAVPGGALTPITGLTPLPGQGWPLFFGVLPASLG